MHRACRPSSTPAIPGCSRAKRQRKPPSAVSSERKGVPRGTRTGPSIRVVAVSDESAVAFRSKRRRSMVLPHRALRDLRPRGPVEARPRPTHSTRILPLTPSSPPYLHFTPHTRKFYFAPLQLHPPSFPKLTARSSLGDAKARRAVGSTATRSCARSRTDAVYCSPSTGPGAPRTLRLIPQPLRDEPRGAVGRRVTPSPVSRLCLRATALWTPWPARGGHQFPDSGHELGGETGRLFNGCIDHEHDPLIPSLKREPVSGSARLGGPCRTLGPVPVNDPALFTRRRTVPGETGQRAAGRRRLIGDPTRCTERAYGEDRHKPAVGPAPR